SPLFPYTTLFRSGSSGPAPAFTVVLTRSHQSERVEFLHCALPAGVGVLFAGDVDAQDGVRHRLMDGEVVRALERHTVDRLGTVTEDLAHRRIVEERVRRRLHLIGGLGLQLRG